jgi:hypothetical protein
MQIRNTIIALILLVVVGGVAYLVSQRQTTEVSTKLFTIAPEDISKIELKYPDRDLVIARDSGGKWQILKPVQTDADQTPCDNLARAIAECEIKKTLQEKPTDLAPFGLDKPAVIVTVTTKKGVTLPSIAVGKTTPVGFSAYLRTSDKPAVLLTSSAFPPGMQKKLEDLRSHELMSFKVDDVQKLTLEHDNGSVTEVDRDGEKWNIVKPARYVADPTEVRQLLSTLNNSRIGEFISDAPLTVRQYGLGLPHLTVTVYTGKENARQSLLFGFKQTEQGKDGIYVRRGESAPVYTVPPYVMSDIDKSVIELRDKQVLGAVSPADVQRVSISDGAAKFALERKGAVKWQVVDGGKTAEADASVVERFLSSIEFLKGATIAADPIGDPAKFKLDKPAVEVSLTGRNGQDLVTLKLSKVEQEAFEGDQPVSSGRFVYYAAASTGTPVFTIDDFNYEQLDKTADQFRSHATPTALTYTPVP